MKEVKFKEKRATSRMGYLPIEGWWIERFVHNG